MLKQFGVEGVKVQEVVSLDADILTSLPLVYKVGSMSFQLANHTSRRPVYGLIFLFKWKDDDAIKQGGKCPDSVWFANQVLIPRQYLLPSSDPNIDCQECLCYRGLVKYCE